MVCENDDNQESVWDFLLSPDEPDKENKIAALEFYHNHACFWAYVYKPGEKRKLVAHLCESRKFGEDGLGEFTTIFRAYCGAWETMIDRDSHFSSIEEAKKCEVEFCPKCIEIKYKKNQSIKYQEGKEMDQLEYFWEFDIEEAEMIGPAHLIDTAEPSYDLFGHVDAITYTSFCGIFHVVPKKSNPDEVIPNILPEFGSRKKAEKEKLEFCPECELLYYEEFRYKATQRREQNVRTANQTSQS